MTITNGYLTAEEAVRYLDVNVERADVAALLDDLVTSISRLIDTRCDRHFWQTSAGTARTFVADHPTCLEFGPFNDLVSVASVTFDRGGDGTFEETFTDYRLTPFNPAAGPETRPYSGLELTAGSLPVAYGSARPDRVKVTGVWGWPAVPAMVKQAARMQLNRAFKRQDSPLGVAGFADFGVIRIARLDPDIEEMLEPYRYRRVMVAP